MTGNGSTKYIDGYIMADGERDQFIYDNLPREVRDLLKYASGKYCAEQILFMLRFENKSKEDISRLIRDTDRRSQLLNPYTVSE